MRSRLTTWPASPTSSASRSYSFGLSASSRSPTQARRAAGIDADASRPDEAGRRAAQQGAHPRHQLVAPEGLRLVVVRPAVQADDGVDLLGAGGQDQDGHGGADGADAATDLQAVDSRQAEVQDDQVVGSGHPGGRRGLAVGDDLHVVALPPERPGQRIRDGGVVFYEEHERHATMLAR